MNKFIQWIEKNDNGTWFGIFLMCSAIIIFVSLIILLEG